MIALKILDLQDFMNKLLIGTDFDRFGLVEASITNFNTFSIDGKIQRDFFDTDDGSLIEQRHLYYSPWKEVKTWCYSVMRGKRTPLAFKIVFQLSHNHMESFFKELPPTISPDLIRGLYLNIQYRNKELYITSGISFQSFFADKSPEHLWDSMICNYLKDHGIVFEIP